MPATQVTQTVNPRPQYAARPQPYGPQQYASSHNAARLQPYTAGMNRAARPQYVQDARQHMGQMQTVRQPQFAGQRQYASQPRTAPRVVSEADQVFDPTINGPVWQTTQQPTRAMIR